MPRPVLVATILLIFTTAVSPCAAGDLGAIKKRRELSFAMTGQYPPFNFIDENNWLTGFGVDICNAIADEIGVRPRPVTTAWPGMA